MKQKTHVRKMGRKDIDGIHSMVRQLAIYEKAEFEFVATLEQYYRDYDAGWFDGLVAYVENEIVGMAVYYESYSTWKGRMLYLEDFVVDRRHRRSGIGQLLFDEFLNEARRRSCQLSKWQVLDWNGLGISFYQKNGAQIESGWLNGKLYL